MKLILYQTDFCQLCDQAAALIYPVLKGKPAQLNLVDISLDDLLIEQYALLIPVLVVEGYPHLQLNWPFSRVDVERLLAKVSG